LLKRIAVFGLIFVVVGLPIVMALFTANVQAGLVWSTETVDSDGYVGRYNSIALDSGDNPHISYMDETKKELKHAWWNGSTWHKETVDSSEGVHGDVSIALDSDDNPHISYTDSTQMKLKHAKWDGSTWNIITLYSVSQYCTSIALDLGDHPYISYYHDGYLKYVTWSAATGWYSGNVDDIGAPFLEMSIAVGSDGNPHISYYANGFGYLKYARRTGPLTWSIEFIETRSKSNNYYPSIALDSDDNPHISYFYAHEQDLEHAWWNGSTWHKETVDSTGNVGQYTSIALDSDDNPHISYRDSTMEELKYAWWDGSTWHKETVDSDGIVGWFTSIALDSSDLAHISYFEFSPHYDLKYARALPIYLTVESTPIDGIDFTINATAHTTNSSVSLLEGTYIVTMPSTWMDGADQYNFVEWEDSSTNPVRSISITSNITIIATYEPKPVPPVASFTFSPTEPIVAETVTFDASASNDPDGTIVSYAWDFGDTSIGSGETTTHSYASDDTYAVTLTVTDDDGLTDTATTNIHVDSSPVDTTPPIGSVVINGGAATTDSVLVTLTLYAEDAESGVAEMRFSNDGSSWSNWEEYATSKAWTLTAGDGTKKVHVRFKNNAELVSDTYSDTIVLSIGKEISSISISMSATTFTVGESTTVSGFLSPLCEGANVTIQCRPSGGTWTTLEKVTTGSDGGYWCTWTPTTVGTYEVRASWEGDENTLSSESVGQLVTVKASSLAAFPWWVLAPAVGGITGVTAVLVYFKRRKPKEEVPKPAEPIITAEPAEIRGPAKKTEEVLKPPEEIPPQKVKEFPKLSAKCCDTIELLNCFIEDPSRTNDRKAWKGFREFITIAEQIEDEYAELIEIRNKLAVLRRKRNEYRSAGLDDLADKTEGLIQSNYGESIRIIKEIQEKLPHLGG